LQRVIFLRRENDEAQAFGRNRGRRRCRMGPRRGGAGEAVWKIKLWAIKLREATRDADIGEVWVSATDGKVVKSDLRINRLD